MGHVSDVEGRCPIKELIKYITNVQAPGNVMEAKAYIERISHYWTFTPNLDSDFKPFCKVTENNLWDSNVECQRALELSKIEMNHKPLPQYDPNKLGTSKNHFLVRDKNFEDIQESRKEQKYSPDNNFQHIVTCHLSSQPMQRSLLGNTSVTCNNTAGVAREPFPL
jgi:hypothetical protein